MPIIITTNDGEQTEKVFSKKEEVKFDNAVQTPKTPEVEESEKKTKESATEENKDGNEDDKSFDYLNSEEEDEESDEVLDEEDDESEEEEKPKKNGFKKRIDKLTKKNSDYEARIAQLEAQLTKPKEEAKPEIKVEDLKEPDINDFEDYKDYVKALSKFEVNEERKAQRQKDEAEMVNKEAQKIIDKYNERLAEAKQRYGEDKWSKLTKVDLPLSFQMRSEIMQSEVGPDMLLFLCSNPEETKRIYNLTPAQQVKELTKLEIKVESKVKGNIKDKSASTEKKSTKAPDPVKPINSKTQGNSVKDPSKMSYKEYKAWRDSQKK